MAVTDPIADMLTRIRNAHMALHMDVNIPKSKAKLAMVTILKDEGYITDFAEDERNISVSLKYMDGRPAIQGLKKVSSPGRRVYVRADDIPQVQNGLGICILSTPKGILDGSRARVDRVGGELLCEIW